MGTRRETGGTTGGRLPEFLVVGPQRTATTRLYERLLPHVVLPKGVKETMFFDRHFSKGLAWYESHFRHGRSDQPVGEIAPTYFHSAEAREHIARTIPHCKIVCTLRDPVSRLYSLYRFMRQYGFTRASFERALEDFPFMMGSSRYAHHVSEWQRLFPRTTVVLYEDLREDPQGYLGAVCRFLEIRPIPLPPELAGWREEATPARFYHLARVGQRTADFLRSARLYRVVNMAKKTGLRRFVFGGGPPLPPMDPARAAELRRLLSPEITRLEAMMTATSAPGRRDPGGSRLRKSPPRDRAGKMVRTGTRLPASPA